MQLYKSRYAGVSYVHQEPSAWTSLNVNRRILIVVCVIVVAVVIVSLIGTVVALVGKKQLH